MNPEDRLLVEEKLNEGQIQRLCDYNRMTIFEENRKLNIKRTPIQIV
jgi:hypothetical protein